MRTPDELAFELEYWVHLLKDLREICDWAEEASKALPIDSVSMLIPIAVNDDRVMTIAENSLDGISNAQRPIGLIIQRCENMAMLAEGRFKALKEEIDNV